MKIHIKIIDEKGNQYEGDANLTKAKLQKSSTRKIEPKEGNMPSSAVRQLYESGFFKDEKKLAEIVNNLKLKGFNFKKGSVVMALKGAEYLIRNGETGRFRFVQKYPPN